MRKGWTKERISRKIGTLIREGKKPAQAVAIAHRMAGAHKK